MELKALDGPSQVSADKSADLSQACTSSNPEPMDIDDPVDDLGRKIRFLDLACYDHMGDLIERVRKLTVTCYQHIVDILKMMNLLSIHAEHMDIDIEPEPEPELFVLEIADAEASRLKRKHEETDFGAPLLKKRITIPGTICKFCFGRGHIVWMKDRMDEDTHGRLCN